MEGEKLTRILRDLRAGLDRILGDRLEAVYLYGSQARGEAQPDSDIDVLVVTRGAFDYFDLLERTSQLTADLSLEYDTVIAKVFVSKLDFDFRETPLLINLRREGIAV
jgi:predicted nucleotidyltransferase